MVKGEDFLGRGPWQIDALGMRLRADRKPRPGFSVRRCARRRRARAEPQQSPVGAPCAPDRERRAGRASMSSMSALVSATTPRSCIISLAGAARSRR